MTRQTSAVAYHEIQANGLLSKRRWEVYDILYRHGPLSCAQIIKIHRKENGNILSTTGSLSTRLSELRDSEVVQEVSENFVCPITNHTVILWDVTKSLPKKLEKKRPKQKCLFCKGTGYADD